MTMSVEITAVRQPCGAADLADQDHFNRARERRPSAKDRAQRAPSPPRRCPERRASAAVRRARSAALLIALIHHCTDGITTAFRSPPADEENLQSSVRSP
jgi:hypothetical protein